MDLWKKFRFFFLYTKSPPWDTNQSPPELIQFINFHPPGFALDLGCGTGTNSIELARNGWRVIGVDFIGKAIQTARKKAQSAGVKVQFIHKDVTRLDNIDGPFDLILDIGCFHSLSSLDRSKYIENIQTRLGKGGTFLLYAFTPDDQSTQNGVNEFDIQSLEQFLELKDRMIGTDRNRKSTWFTFQNSLS
jgi:cyclopropane fatty-acyl-phospholipid synthase-like methyltransferase